MSTDETAPRIVTAVLARQLALLQRSTGLPVVFGGPVVRSPAGRHLEINHVRGTFGASLHRLAVRPSLGLGGVVIATGRARRVNDYASAAAITHDYDSIVVREEKITSIFAYPVTWRGQVHGVLYGAVRDHRPVGDRAIREAGALAQGIARDVAAVVEAAAPGSVPTVSPRHTVAVQELGELTNSVADPALRARLSRIHRQLDGTPRTDTESTVTVPPRVLDVLEHAATGATNAEIADALGLSHATVKTYLQDAMRRLGVHNRARAVLAARSAGLLP